MFAITFYLIFCMLATLWFDVTRYMIPNWLVGSLLLLYPLAVYLHPAGADWKMALLGMAIVFAVGYAIFAAKLMGGGDIKLVTVCALWVGLEQLLGYIFIVTLLGGALAGGLWVIRKLLPRYSKIDASALPRILRNGEPAPYGVAIAIGFLIMLFKGLVPVIH